MDPYLGSYYFKNIISGPHVYQGYNLGHQKTPLYFAKTIANLADHPPSPYSNIPNTEIERGPNLILYL
jgi:hypothetical protein